MKITKAFFAVALFFATTATAWGQALPIAIDSRFEDWADATATYTDPPGSTSGVDLLRFAVTNDEQYLFLLLELDGNLVLTENNPLLLYLDTDNNALTGKVVNGIGAELEIKMGDREVIYHLGNASYTFGLNDIRFRYQPTVSSGLFEMAIGRQVNLLGNAPLFSGNTVRVYFRYGATGDQMPNAGSTFSYQFDNTPTPAQELFPLEKDFPDLIRLLTWNTLHNGLGNVARAERFRKVVAAMKPDIVTFNECWDLTAQQVASFMNQALPLGNFQSWHTVKLDDGNVTASRFPFLQNWYFYPGYRLTASLIDLPDHKYQRDLLVVNAHLRCCSGGNYFRQLEADAFAAFILDAKTPGGEIDLPEGTPFVLSGDLNLVGWQQQLQTLLTGQIVNTSIFGTGGPLDWDGSDLLDVISLHTDQRMAYTWRKDNSSFPPSRLDFHICSNSVMQVEKAFTLQTESMPPNRLAQYGLLPDDTGTASDHLPKVTDFDLSSITIVHEQARNMLEVKTSPNPVNQLFRANFQVSNAGEVQLALLRQDGTKVRQWHQSLNAGPQTLEVNMEGLPAGI